MGVWLGKWVGKPHRPTNNTPTTPLSPLPSLPHLPAQAAHRPLGGLAAASTLVRDFSTVVMPAFAIEMVCCSMACRRGETDRGAESGGLD